MSAIPETKPAVGQEIELRFNQMAERWLTETAVLSSPTATMNHPAFQEIVAMGEAVIPLVLREMGKDRGHWFLALARITGENPIEPTDRGKIDRIEAAWVRWAREHGYSW